MISHGKSPSPSGRRVWDEGAGETLQGFCFTPHPLPLSLKGRGGRSLQTSVKNLPALVGYGSLTHPTGSDTSNTSETTT